MASEEIKFTIYAVSKGSAVFGKFAGGLSKVAKTAAKASAVMVGTGGALLAFTNKIADGDDKVAKFAKRIGEATEGLSQYQFVASQAGVPTEQFNMAVQRMTRRVSEAAKGTGEAVGALRELGINAKEFQKLPLDKKMETLSKSMEGTSSESDRLRLAFKLFDSEGTAMIQMLGQGSEAMKKAAEDAQFLGLVVDKEAAAKAELFKDSMGRLTGSLKGVSRGIAGELMPLFSGLADTMADTLARNRQNIINFVKNATIGFFSLVEVVKQVFTSIKKSISDPKLFSALINGLQSLAVKFSVGGIALGKFLVTGLWEGIKLAKELFVGFGEWIGESFAQIVLGQAITPLSEKLAEKFAKGFEKARESMEGEMEELSSVLGVLLPEIGEQLSETFGVNLDDATEKAKRTIESLSLFAESTKEMITETAETTNEFMTLLDEQRNIFLDEMRNSNLTFLETLRSTATATIDNISQAVGSAIVDGTNLQKSFRAIAKSVLKEVIAALVKMGIQRLLLSTINVSTTQAEASAEASRSIAASGANMFASWAGAPWPISLGAPAAAAAAIAGATAAYSAGAAAGKGAAALVAHGGLTNNPNEQTAIIQAGERIVSPRQNRDLTEALDNGSIGGGLNIDTLNITLFPNATNADAVFDMDREELKDYLGGAIIEVLNDLDRQGIAPNFVDRNE